MQTRSVPWDCVELQSRRQNASTLLLDLRQASHLKYYVVSLPDCSREFLQENPHVRYNVT